MPVFWYIIFPCFLLTRTACVQMGLDALAMSEKKYRVPDFVQHVAAAVPELKTAVLELLDYSERRAERRRATFMGTDSFEDVM